MDYWSESTYKDTIGRTLKEYQVTKKGCELIAHKTNGEKGVLFTVKYMDRFEEMENYIKGNKSAICSNERAKTTLELFQMAADFLKLNDNSRLLGVQTIFEENGLSSSCLPQYTESKDQLLSATELLKRNNINVSAQKFNKTMIEKGFMEIRERPSKKWRVKQFKALTNLEYGENQVSPKNPQETQALYYVDKFIDLCKVLELI